MRSLVFGAALLFAGTAPAQAQLVWPTNCVPAHVGPTGAQVLEKCATIGPEVAGELSSITIYDPATGYRAPDEVIVAVARQDDIFTAVSLGVARNRRGCEPQNQFDVDNALSIEQVNDLAWLAAAGPRDNGDHVVFTALKSTRVDDVALALCGSDEGRCWAATWFVSVVERASVAWGNHAARSIGNATLAAMHDLYFTQEPDLSTCPQE